MSINLYLEGVRNFNKENNLALNFRWIAVNDYAASRCCFLNGLLSQGFVLGEQAIEKELKSILLLINPNENVRSLPNHQIIPIIDKIHNQSELNLKPFLEFGKKLSEFYELSRYPNNKLSKVIKTWGMGSDEIDFIDEMYFYLDRITLIPDEVKYRSGIHAFFFDKNNFLQKAFGNWITIKNKEYKKVKGTFEEKYMEVRIHLFGENSKLQE